MKWWRIRKLANAASWEMMFFGAGILAGMVLAVVLPGILTAPMQIDGNPAQLADLDMQRSMTISSWWMVAVSTLSCVVGGASLYLIALTLREARRSANAADQAVRVALNSMEGARNIGQAQVRAYIVISSASIHPVENDLMVEFQFKNSGQTPAMKVSTNASMSLRSRERGSWSEPTPVLSESRERSNVPSGETRFGRIRLGWRNYAQMQDGWARKACELRLVVNITCEDVFGARHLEQVTYGMEIPAGYPLNEIEPLARLPEGRWPTD